MFLPADDLFAQKSKKKTKKKEPEKASTVSKAFQDLTTRYNFFYNARLKYMEGIDQLEQGHKDNYDELLPVYVYTTGDGTKISTNLDATIKKTSIAIQKKPNSKWVDDCYLLLGKAFYLMGDEENAVNSFQLISNEFGQSIRNSYNRKDKDIQKAMREEEKAKRKKEEEEKRKQLEKEREEDIKQREQDKKDREKAKKEAKKERDKEKAQKVKDKAKERKEREKERKKTQKEKDKEKKQKLKEREKAKKEREKYKKIKAKYRAKGKEPPPPNYKYYKGGKTQKDKDTEEEKEEENDSKSKTKKEKTAKKNSKKDKDAEAEDALEDNEEEIVEEETEATEEESEGKEKSIVKTVKGEEKIYQGGGFLKHKPAKHEAAIWLARTFIDNKKFAEANAVFDAIAKTRRFPKRLKGELYRLKAHYHLQKRDKTEAKDALETAIRGTKRKSNKARLHYILAQLEEQSGNHKEALKAYKRVLKSRPDYVMEFHTRLNIAKTKVKTGDYSVKRALASLEKMTKEGKNEEFQDQIFFTMSQMALENGDDELANKYLEQSAQQGTSNPAQKATAFLKIAELNYEKENYILASAYYDSTMNVLPKTVDNYDEVAARQTTLEQLTKHLKIIAGQDSLQRIANMPEGERIEFLEELIDNIQKEIEQQRLEEEQRLLAELNNKNKDASGKFYWSNDKSISTGFNEFRNRWGNRPLADNWRVSSKINAAGFNNDVASGTKEDEGLASIEDRIARGERLKVDDLLAELPLTKEQKKKSNQMIANALYKAGRIFKEDLNNLPQASKHFKRLADSYPKNENAAEAYYNLYLTAQEEGNTKLANEYKKTLIKKYPESLYAKLAEDKDYLLKAKAEGNKLEEYYEETFSLYEKEKYDEVISRKSKVNELFDENPLQPKFDLLAAFALGATEDKNTYIAALENVVQTYPNDEVEQKAKEMLAYLKSNSGPKPNAGGSTSENSSTYKTAPDQQHYFVLVLDQFTKKINAVKNKISDFNNNNFSVNKLKVVPMGKESTIIMIRTFPNAAKAMPYYKAMQQQEVSVLNDLDVGYKFFVISKSNFSQFFKNRDTEEYLQFFLEKY